MQGKKNLKPLTSLSPEEAREIRSKGGKARQKQMQERKTFRLMFESILNGVEQGQKLSYLERIAMSMIKAAIEGDVKAAQFVRDTKGEKPKEEITQTITNPIKFITSDEFDEDYD